MSSTWNILYRGSLSSCNYACGYCPFAKTANTLAELQQDKAELMRFVAWVANQTRRIGILITPWGEALVHRYYRRAMTALSQMPHVYRVAVQTNLSAPLVDFAEADLDALALWATFHPSETSVDRFAAKCQELDRCGIRYSVGVVGLREHFAEIEQLRAALSKEVYLWINAYKREPDYYHPAELERLSQIDPYFHWNTHRYPTAGEPCDAGFTSFTVDGHGHMRRCHFIGNVIGNIYEPGFGNYLEPRTCSMDTCGCHIGYVHRPNLRLQELYGAGLLERIPAQWPSLQAEFAQGVLSGHHAKARSREGF
jgi:MoaA/NifB/PqqE/SkfB family radical SAM enzyme